MPQVGNDPLAQSHASYEASALTPSHHGCIQLGIVSQIEIPPNITGKHWNSWRLLFGDFLGLTLLVIFLNYFCLQNLIVLICGEKFPKIYLGL